ncbi:MAG: 50S ribosomal protein L35 [Chthonomonadales bacterium]
MAKLKTRKAAAKRFKVTATGKIVHRSIGLNHLMRKKSMSERRRLLKGNVLSKAQEQRVKRMLGMA